MKLRERAIWLLLRIYPAAWRHEFGAEFEELLKRAPLGVPVIANVMAGALGERVMELFRRIAGRSEMVDQTFGARYDRLAQIVSAGAVLLLIAVSAALMRTGAVAAFVALLSVAVIALGFAFSPRGFEISGGVFRVKRLIGDVVFPLDRLRFVRDATGADFRGCVRLCGSGGLFGYYGWFWSKALGRSKWYVTDRNKALVVADGDQIVLISPEDRDGFVAALGRADQRLSATGARSASSRSAWPLAVGIAITGVVLALLALAFLYAPGRPAVDLTQDSLVIHSRFYGMTVQASSVDVANVRVVNLGAEPGWKPVLRTDGFGNPHYQAGNFQTANGRAVKLFTTGSQRLVLLPPSGEDGMPVLLDTTDPDRFAARVRKEWNGR